MSLGQLYNGREIGNVAFHAEDAIDDDQFVFSLVCFESSFESVYVVMLIFPDLAEGEATAVHDACMIGHVDNRGIVALDKSGDHSQIGLVAGREDQRSFFPQEPCQLFFQFFVDFKIPV